MATAFGTAINQPDKDVRVGITSLANAPTSDSAKKRVSGLAVLIGLAIIVAVLK